ncbi:MAG: glycerol-3-phosphate dehydrogenase [Proteobacteria bacterium]|nr:MAG: glycerol-3-phosphate dehydrogenase [Pseudomonadota bacterium]PIE40394.1 MAG: glycerol-3-phosphate dehydrogenase [Gammaproteobacteria bacterium]
MDIKENTDLSAWQPGWRERTIERLQAEEKRAGASEWDMVIIGGGITGAGVFREATRRNLKVLLVEQKDFAWGTSSKSSKMVHGGLRYLGSGQIRLTHDSVQERQRLMSEAPGLVDPLHFLMGHYRFSFPGPIIFNLLLTFYDWMARRWSHRFHSKRDTSLCVPGMRDDKLNGATEFGDAVTDDARLVLRVLQEGVAEGGCALSYVAADHIEAAESGKAESGKAGAEKKVTLLDEETGASFSVRAKVVINATGAWTDALRKKMGKDAVIRPLRGSHLIFPQWRVPVSYAVSFFHPADKRPVFLFPWEGVTVVGNTDLDHSLEGRSDISISREEVDYLLEALNFQFPGAKVTEADAIASYSGIRPVVGTGALNPSSEKREHSIWDDDGVISVAGGKLTTFRLIALDVLDKARPHLPGFELNTGDAVIFKHQSVRKVPVGMTTSCFRRLLGRYGTAAGGILGQPQISWQKIRTTDTLWGELEWVLANEQVVHLDDLLLRRTRIGLLLAEGGEEIMPRVKSLCIQHLLWSASKWQKEYERYRLLWQNHFGLPSRKAREEGPAAQAQCQQDTATDNNVVSV